MSVDINTLLTAQSDIHLHGKINVKLEENGYSKPHETRLTRSSRSVMGLVWKATRAHYKEAFDESEYNTSQFADSAKNSSVCWTTTF